MEDREAWLEKAYSAVLKSLDVVVTSSQFLVCSICLATQETHWLHDQGLTMHIRQLARDRARDWSSLWLKASEPTCLTNGHIRCMNGLQKMDTPSFAGKIRGLIVVICGCK